jgi:signal transduction histidine kinase
MFVDGRLIYSPTTPNSAPTAAGALPGQDAILAVDGHGIVDTRDLVRAVHGITRFSPFLLTVLRPSGATVTFEVTPWFRPMRVEWICELVFCLSLAIMAFVLSWRLPQEPYTPPLVLAALLMLLFTSVMPFSFQNVPTNALANAGNISSWLLVVFAVLFPRKRGSRPARAAGFALLLTAYGAFCVARTIIFARWMGSGQEMWLSLYKRLGEGIVVSDAIAYAALCALLASAYVRSRLPRDRRMLQWLLAGFLLAVPPYFFMNQLPLILGEASRSIGLGSLSLLFLSILPIFLLIALTRRSELNVGSFLARYAVYATLLVIMVALFGVLFIPLKRYMENAYRLPSPMPELFSAGVIVVFLLLLRIPVDRLFAWKRRPEIPEGAPGNGLAMIIGQLARESARTMSAQRLTELRVMLAGIARAIKEPVRQLASGIDPSDDRGRERAAADVLHFVRTLESLSGTTPSIRGNVDIAALAYTTVQDARIRFPAASFHVDAQASARLCCYPEELAHALGSVLDNAAEARASGDSSVTLRTIVDEERIVMEVSDNGPGFDAFVRRKISRPFFTTKPGHQGLGLYFARMLVERNEGSIESSRGPAGGALMRIVFSRDSGAEVKRGETL